MPKDTLRILCLHGYRQSGEIFRQKTGSLRKALKKYGNFVYVTAPLLASPLEGEEISQGKGWWYSREDNYFKASDASNCIKGFDDSLKVLTEFIATEGSFDGILGFSQGGGMVSLLCGLQQQGKLPFSFKFAIIVAGFKSKSTPHENIYSVKVDLPTLHVFGETDQVIVKEMSEELTSYFKDPVVIKHTGGHFVPASSDLKDQYVKFFENMKSLCS